MNPDGDSRPPGETAPDDDVLAPLSEADAIRATLGEIARRAGRLIVLLRPFRKQPRVLQAAWASLRQPHLGPKGGA
jgi:hypothetical protein